MKTFSIVTLAALLGATAAAAHPVPDSTITMSVADHAITAEVTIPLSELNLVYPLESADLTAQADGIAAYLTEHTQVTSVDGTWDVSFSDITSGESDADDHGHYSMLTAQMLLVPPTELTDFTLDYDAVVGEVLTHGVEVSWADADVLIGEIEADAKTGVVAPLQVELP
ncbi:hypothetical protein [Marivivens aquimaris]|uniref:hypothetical protein n=1 Tax=Marivivens aquimaris TaxID=2774876 RepID=UPI001881F122|nr:hypothetical protein [Marivivens aquimaris]